MMQDSLKSLALEFGLLVAAGLLEDEVCQATLIPIPSDLY